MSGRQWLRMTVNAAAGVHSRYDGYGRRLQGAPHRVGGMELESVAPNEVPEGAQLIDVREQSEWDAGHAPGAQHLPASSLLEKLGELPEDGDLYIVCRTGGRSAQVSQWLNGNGYDAINVRGGMDQWFESGLPLEADGDHEPFVL